MNKRLSIWSGAVGDCEDPIKMVRQITTAGFGYSELSSAHSRRFITWRVSERESFRSFAESEGLLFRQGHLLNQVDLSSTDQAKRLGFIDDEKRCLDLYLDLGIEIGVIHTGGWKRFFKVFH